MKVVFCAGMQWPLGSWLAYRNGDFLLRLGASIQEYGFNLKHDGLYRRVKYWYDKTKVLTEQAAAKGVYFDPYL